MPSRESSLQSAWRLWVDVLRRLRLDGVAILLLDGGGPIALLSAQLLYASGPFLGAGAERLARLLESESDTAAFADYLRSGRHEELGEGRGGA